MLTIFLIHSVERLTTTSVKTSLCITTGIQTYHSADSTWPCMTFWFLFYSFIPSDHDSAKTLPQGQACHLPAQWRQNSVTSRGILCLPSVSVTGKRLLHPLHTACHTHVSEKLLTFTATSQILMSPSIQLVWVIMLPRLVLRHISIQIVFISYLYLDCLTL